MKLHDLQPPSGSHKPSRRVGRGHGSGRGKTAEQLLGTRGAEEARRPHEYVERPAPAFPSGGQRGR